MTRERVVISDFEFGISDSLQLLFPPSPRDKGGRNSLLRLLRPVPAAGLFAVGDAQRIEDAADDLVAYAGEVAHAAAADEDDRVFLQVVSFAGDVSGNFLAVRQPHAGHL